MRGRWEGLLLFQDPTQLICGFHIPLSGISSSTIYSNKLENFIINNNKTRLNQKYKIKVAVCIMNCVFRLVFAKKNIKYVYQSILILYRPIVISFQREKSRHTFHYSHFRNSYPSFKKLIDTHTTLNILLIVLILYGAIKKSRHTLYYFNFSNSYPFFKELIETHTDI